MDIVEFYMSDYQQFLKVYAAYATRWPCAQGRQIYSRDTFTVQCGPDERDEVIAAVKAIIPDVEVAVL